MTIVKSSRANTFGNAIHASSAISVALPAPVTALIMAFFLDFRASIAIGNASAFRTAFSSDPEKTLQTAFDVLKQRAGLAPNDKVVVISDVLAGTGIEAIQIRHLPD